MSALVNVQINYFGPNVPEGDIQDLLNGKYNSEYADVTKMLFESFFELPFNALSKIFIKRYFEVTTNDAHINIVPSSPQIQDKLLKPLKSAKRNYCLGDYLATIAVCGVIGEMLAILIWDINELKINNNNITVTQEKELFGRSFEDLGQYRRLDILRTFNIINEAQCNDFHYIRTNRNKYLHSWTANFDDEQIVALEAVKKSFILFKGIAQIGPSKEKGKISINPLLLKLMQKSAQ